MFAFPPLGNNGIYADWLENSFSQTKIHFCLKFKEHQSVCSQQACSAKHTLTEPSSSIDAYPKHITKLNKITMTR